MKTASVELEAGGVRCYGQFFNLDLHWFLVSGLDLELAKPHTQFFCERRKCDGASPAVRQCTMVRYRVHRRGARTTEKRFCGPMWA
jgi:hypothetical protein